MSSQELKCKDCGKGESEASNFHKESKICNACSSKRWRKKKKKGKIEAQKPSKSQVKRVTAQKAEAKCIDCGISASEVRVFNYKRGLCSKCNLRKNYGPNKGKVPAKTQASSKKKPLPEKTTPENFEEMKERKKREGRLYDFIVGRKLPYAEGNIISLLCSYAESGSLKDLSEAYTCMTLLIANVELEEREKGK